MNFTTITPNGIPTKLDNLKAKVESMIPEYNDMDKIVDYVQRNGLLPKSNNSNYKISKSNKSEDYLTSNLSLLPASLSGFNVCPFHAHCVADCIGVFSGRNIYPTAIRSKLVKTLLFHRDSELFIQILMKELTKFRTQCTKAGKLPAFRLNTYSDIIWESKFPEIFSEFSEIQFYDYTKVYIRQLRTQPANYDLTYSAIASYHNSPEHIFSLAENDRVSMVVSKEIFNRYFENLREGQTIRANGLHYHNGDIDDMTFRYPNEKTVLVLQEKTRYKIDQNNLNPLVYRDAKMIGL